MWLEGVRYVGSEGQGLWSEGEVEGDNGKA